MPIVDSRGARRDRRRRRHQRRQISVVGKMMLGQPDRIEPELPRPPSPARATHRRARETTTSNPADCGNRAGSRLLPCARYNLTAWRDTIDCTEPVREDASPFPTLKTREMPPRHFAPCGYWVQGSGQMSRPEPAYPPRTRCGRGRAARVRVSACCQPKTPTSLLPISLAITAWKAPHRRSTRCR